MWTFSKELYVAKYIPLLRERWGEAVDRKGSPRNELAIA